MELKFELDYTLGTVERAIVRAAIRDNLAAKADLEARMEALGNAVGAY